MSIANAFAKSGHKKYWSFLLPDGSGTNYNGGSGNINNGGVASASVTTTKLTTSWRLNQLQDTSTDAFLTVEYYDTKSNKWIPTYTFNAIKS